MIHVPNKSRGSKTEYERILNDAPVPDNLKNQIPPIKFYGRWLRTKNLAQFDKMYQKWLEAQ
jgi:hypothetical protein